MNFFVLDLNSSTEYTIICGLCGCRLKNSEDLQKHIWTQHCTDFLLCDSNSSSKSTLKNELTAHSSDKLFYCSWCHYSCTEENNLRTHMLVHSGEKPFLCCQCDFSCSDESSLARHVLDHSEKESFHCSLCDYSCPEKSNFRTHLRQHFPWFESWLLKQEKIK